MMNKQKDGQMPIFAIQVNISFSPIRLKTAGELCFWPF